MQRSFLLLLSLPIFASAAMAQDVLDPLVVTASRTDLSLRDIAYTTSVLDSREIRDETRRTVPEALQLVPGVLVQKTANGHGSPFIRGFTGRQNLLLFDGVRLNNSIWRSGPVQYWNTVDLLSVDRMELVKSQGSVLYGSDAIGGTLNVFGRGTGFRNEADGAFFTHGAGYYEFRTNGRGSHIGRLESVLGVGGKWGLRIGVSAKDFGDIRDSGVGLMRRTGYPEQDLDLRFDVALDADDTLSFAHYRVNQDDIWRWHRTRYNPGWQHGGHVTTPGSYFSNIYDQERTLTYLRYSRRCQEDGGWLRRADATVSWQTNRDSESQKRKATDRRYQTAEVDTFGFDLELESPLGPGALVYGVDYYRDSVDSGGWRDRTGAGLVYTPSYRPVADDSTYDLFGAYAQYQWEALENLRIDAGGRYTWAQARLGRNWDAATGRDASASNSWDEAVFSGRAIYTVGGCWGIYGGATQAFRAPNLNDLSGNLTSRSGNQSLGSLGVDPEKAVTLELGARRTTDDAYLNFSAFYTDIDDIITSIPVAAGSRTRVTTNGQDAYIYGIEAEGSWHFHPQWTISAFAAWMDGHTRTAAFLGGPVVEEPPSRVAPLSGSLALRWTHPSAPLWIEGRLLASVRADRLSASDRRDTQRIPSGGTPGYVVAMLHAGWTPNDHLEFTLGLENLTDEDYRIHGSGQNEPGFGAILAARAIW
jgi:hemoglobin/transferrin/lactoferrin receptor protein